jgi:hypothetical protein
MPVSVPNVVGLSSADAPKILAAQRLRYILRYPEVAHGDGSVTEQNPVAGTLVPLYSVVTVTLPVPFGFGEPDRPVDGPYPNGNMEGFINGVRVDQRGAWIDFATLIEGDAINISDLALYRDQPAPPSLLPRTEWMRRGAMLGLAQRALTNNHNVRLFTTGESFLHDLHLVQSIEILKL